MLSKGLLPSAHRSQCYGTGFAKGKACIARWTNKNAVGEGKEKSQVCIPNKLILGEFIEKERGGITTSVLLCLDYYGFILSIRIV
jgi:hypothetical protein